MTVYYFEGNPIVAPVTFRSNEPFFSSDTISLKQSRASMGAQRWELEFGLQSNQYEDDYLISMVASVGTAKTLIMPQLPVVTRTVTAVATGTVASVTAANSSTVSVSFADSAKLIPKASFIKFSNHAKIYILKSAVTTNGAAVTLSIFPTLRSAVGLSTTVYHAGTSTKPVLQYYQSISSLQGVTFEDGVLMNPGTIELIEAL